jgi:CMP-N-acetylneuraminic acid synthetase
MEVLALITARGGSKGLPRKNIISFLGRPLIYWSVGAAREARRVTRVVVSTDDAAIAEAGRDAGAEVPFLRPSELSQDETPDLPVFVHALDWLHTNERYIPDLIVHLRPTTPLRPAGLIDRGIELMISDEAADSVRTVCRPHNNPFKMWRIVDGVLDPLIKVDIPEPYNQPRQRLPEAFWQTGTIDVTRPRTIRCLNSMTGSKILPLVIDASLAVDIDDEFSLRLAELVCRRAGMADAI